MTYLLVDTRRQFLQAFRDFWASGPASRILSALRESPCPYCSCVRSWTKGGCLVCAEAMRHWIVNSVDTLARGVQISLAAVATDETEAAHVLVVLRKAGEERFMDADGVWSRQALRRRLAREYEYDAHALVPWEEVAVERVRIAFDAEIVQYLEAALAQFLGPFSPAYVFPISWGACRPALLPHPRGEDFLCESEVSHGTGTSGAHAVLISRAGHSRY